MKARYVTFLGTAFALAISCNAVAQSNAVSKETQLSQASSSPQTPTQPVPSAPQRQIPAPGASQTPQAQPQLPGQPSQTDVSQEELQKFANAVKKLQPIQQEAETQINQAIQQQDLSEERFGEIYQSRQNPKAKPEKKITREENKKFEQVSTKIQEIQQATQTRMEQTVRTEGLDIQRFNQIFLSLKRNPELLQKVRQLIKS